MDGGEVGASVALGLFVVGLIYHAGQTTQRLTVVERDQNRLYDELRTITGKIEELKGMIRGEVE